MCASTGESTSLPPWVAKACQCLLNKGASDWKANAALTYERFADAALAEGRVPQYRPPVLDTGEPTLTRRRCAALPWSARADAKTQEASRKRKATAEAAEAPDPKRQDASPASSSQPSAETSKGKGVGKQQERRLARVRASPNPSSATFNFPPSGPSKARAQSVGRRPKDLDLRGGCERYAGRQAIAASLHYA